MRRHSHFPADFLDYGKGWLNPDFSSILEAVRLRKTFGENRGGSPNTRVSRWRLGMEGQSRTRTLLFLLLLAALAYVGNQLVAAYVDYLELRETVRLVVRDIALRPQWGADEGLERILAKARELELPLSERQVDVTDDGETVVARVRWEEPVGVGDYTIPFPFEIEESYRLLER
ncbi:MAG: hypothetical protein ACE5K9_07965 [Candidatus Methylomirabilales bacterium]